MYITHTCVPCILLVHSILRNLCSTVQALQRINWCVLLSVLAVVLLYTDDFVVGVVW